MGGGGVGGRGRERRIPNGYMSPMHHAFLGAISPKLCRTRTVRLNVLIGADIHEPLFLTL